MENPTTLTLIAPAKVNLFLHVIGKLGSGYHALDSMVAFAEIGDRLHFTPSPSLTLTISGPYSTTLLEDATHNLVDKAATLLQARCDPAQGMHIHLEKNLPIGAGLGGGSSDAATTLHALKNLWKLSITEEEILDIAISLGADVPVCYHAKPCMMRGIGERITPFHQFPSLHAVLVTPNVHVSTPQAYKAMTPPYDTAMEGIAEGFATTREVMAILAITTNSFLRPALQMAPVIADALSALEQTPGCQLARLSGSGPTCFGIFSTAEEAQHAATVLRADNTKKDWWIEATKLGAASVS